MNHDERFELHCRGNDTDRPVLQSVTAAARLDGVLFTTTLRQAYRNDSQSVLEVVYTFPLPHGAVLLGFATELNGQRQVGTIVAKRQAEQRYEKALAEGDAPVMLEQGGSGLHTANIGNLKPRDELVVELRFARELSFEQGRLRLSIPTTVAPRYGDAAAAGLQPQQVPATSLLVEYPFKLSLTIGGALADADVECPTHRVQRSSSGDGLMLQLDSGAWLDRDVVVTVTPKTLQRSLCIESRDACSVTAPVVAMASFQVPTGRKRERVALKLLIDCSGSMGGDSIVSARAAVTGILMGLSAASHVSFSRFGSTVEHVLAPVAATLRTNRLLAGMVARMQADLGGTEMAEALQSVIGLPMPSGAANADILLVTDGEIWATDAVVRAAIAGGHRVFAIGVGSSPAERLLRSMAEATGGACEFAAPGEALQAAARRMLDRIEQAPSRDISIDWGMATEWQTTLPRSVFGGDTLTVFAGLQEGLAAKPVRLVAHADSSTSVVAEADPTDSAAHGQDIARIAASRRMAGAGDDIAAALALNYQLLGRHTHCVLVHERADGDKSVDDAVLHRVTSMTAAGWAGTGRLQLSDLAMPLAAPLASGPTEASASIAPPIMWSMRTMRPVPVPLPVPAPEAPDMMIGFDIGIPAFLSTEKSHRPTLQDLLAIVAASLARGDAVDALPQAVRGAGEIHPDLQAAIDAVIAPGPTEGQAWLLLASWVDSRSGGGKAVELAPHLSAIDDASHVAAAKVYDDTLGHYLNTSWTPSRLHRLKRAMSNGLGQRR